jgi:hypothetical protein
VHAGAVLHAWSKRNNMNENYIHKNGEKVAFNKKKFLLLKLLFVSNILPNSMAYSMQGKDKGYLHNISLEI